MYNYSRILSFKNTNLNALIKEYTKLIFIPSPITISPYTPL